jgi:hypothetical protein
MGHVVGSWRVGALPGNYGTEKWQTIASSLGIQTAAVGGFMFLHKELSCGVGNVESGAVLRLRDPFSCLPGL